jgi:hypothetical protein
MPSSQFAHIEELIGTYLEFVLAGLGHGGGVEKVNCENLNGAC